MSMLRKILAENHPWIRMICIILIFAGAVIGLVESGNKALGIILFIFGILDLISYACKDRSEQ